jgi:hypothetical protein
MSIVTLGIYQEYWIFKNWEYLKNRDNLNIHPFWRGVFGIFFCHELLKAIHDDPSLNKNKSPEFNHSLLATGWVIIAVLQAFLNYGYKISNINTSPFYLIVAFVLVVIQTLFFIPVQRFINDANEKIVPTPYYYPWSIGHFVMIGLVIAALLVGASIGMNTPPPVQTYYIPPVPTLPPPPVNLTETTTIPLASPPPVQMILPQYVIGGQKYTIPDTQTGIFVPYGWTEYSKSISFGGSEYPTLTTCSPDMTTCIVSFGMNVSGMAGTTSLNEGIIDQGYVDSDTYQGLISGLESTSNNPPNTNVIQDPTYYSMDGHPTRKLEFDSGNTHIEAYFIVYDVNTWVIEELATTTQSTQNERSTGEYALNFVTY